MSSLESPNEENVQVPGAMDLVETGYVEPNPAQTPPDNPLREIHKKDAKTLFLIQLVLDDESFPRITTTTNSKQAWDTLKQEYLGEQKVSGIVNHMKTYGENVSNEMVVSKSLRSLTKGFDHVVAAIEESKDLSTYNFDELMSSLLAHEVRIRRSYEKVEEKAFQVVVAEEEVVIEVEVVETTDEEDNLRDDQKQANFTEEVEEGSKLCMTQSSVDDGLNGVWFMDSGCSNQMSGTRSLFKELDESKKSEVRLGDNKPMKVEGKSFLLPYSSLRY
ncbi:hypothetical protein KY290_036765 [Solanum tuberosum]|uniref:Retrovirus-related Pol polyprotein from transposon TNT 1-94-like beta-barrel domain-containing protein n=1 Tax=Solanum tuberosum TaxID=4113 RepID=A0ABQ7TUA8_SOLTU|nr:hypothetical protein KY289_036248 [Solanum tuberosum]KAH0639498.1 hypothetical protein KY285_036084 [Solanum tuberosum]KAH0738060.1 hypothetical protein KY290_036765 [Solanum tuberosum]